MVTAAAAGSTASPAAAPEEIGPDGWPKSMRACLKASGFEMKSVEGGTIVVTRDVIQYRSLAPWPVGQPLPDLRVIVNAVPLR